MKSMPLFSIIAVALLINCSTSTSTNPEAATEQSMPGGGKTLVLQKMTEPREQAFIFLVPKGWIVEGGIFRVDPNTMGGPAQSIEAKIDMSLKKDPGGQVMTRWLPDLFYVDMSGQYAGGMFPVGSTNNGMIVMPKMPAAQYLTQVVFPYLHKDAANMQVLEQKSNPGLISIMKEEDRAIMVPLAYDAASVVVQYDEKGVTFKEVMVSGIMDFGQLGAGTWKNRHSFILRAPAAEFDQWKKTFAIVLNSIQMNPAWVRREIQSQIQAGIIVARTQAEIQRIEDEIHAGHRRTNDEIMNDAYLTLTGKEEYVNPFTKEVETGTNEYNYRWQNSNGDIIYTDNMNYNPNRDPELKIQGFEKSLPRKR